MRTKTKIVEKTYIGLDNGVSGSIGIISPTGTSFFHIPTKSTLDYTKDAKNVTRIDVVKLEQLLWIPGNYFLVMERPMVNPTRFTATKSAMRALEATLIVLEKLDIPYRFIDSKEWQKDMLPKKLKGTEALKKASKDVGTRLFPQFKDLFKKDADGLLIAEWARRMRL